MSDQTKATKTEPADGGKPPDFENALKELEALVARLENGDLTLDESLKQFKRGVELTRQCQKTLDQAQQVVEQLSNPEDESSATTVKQPD